MAQKKILVFGVFDRLHEGHVHFLLGAKALGDYLIVTVAQDAVVKRLKGKEPSMTLERRMRELKRYDYVDEVVAGDDEEGSWKVLKDHAPDIIALGYDQDELKKALAPLARELGFSIYVLTPYEPEKYHSILLG